MSLHQTSESPTPKVSPATKNISAICPRAALYHGFYSRVARSLGTTTSHVRRVALGQRQSARIAAAIVKEAERIEQELLSRAAPTLKFTVHPIDPAATKKFVDAGGVEMIKRAATRALQPHSCKPRVALRIVSDVYGDVWASRPGHFDAIQIGRAR